MKRVITFILTNLLVATLYATDSEKEIVELWNESEKPEAQAFAMEGNRNGRSTEKTDVERDPAQR